MSGDWEPIEIETPHERPSNQTSDESYPIDVILSRTIDGMSTYPDVVTSPAS